jgi:DNA-binding NtrC family response regulator
MALYGNRSALVLLPETDRDAAMHVAGGIVATDRLGEPPLVAGVATFPERGTGEELVEAARQAARKATLSARVHVATTDDDAAERKQRSVVIASPKMREVYDLVRKIAPSPIPVLILGETGSGKEVVAAAIHNGSPRRNGPQRSVNCGAIPPTLIESILFGHERGAFTGADRSAPGLFEQADGGTILLDEVGELSQAAQAALLRVLETKRLMRVGGTEEIEVDVRVIAATHRELEVMADEGKFRRDLLYRLNTMTLHVPPLRDRPEEIEALADLFREEASRASGSTVRAIDEEALARLRSHSWPGNVRELRNTIERAVLVCRGDTITVEDLGERLRGSVPPLTSASEFPGEYDASDETDVAFKDRIRDYETQLIVDALRKCNGNQTAAAKMLKMPLRTLVHKIRTYGIKKLYEA